MLFSLKRKPEPTPLEIAGIRVKASARARRMALRVEAASGEVVLTWPCRGASEKSALRFIAENKNWIDKQRARRISVMPIADAGKLSVLGIAYAIERREGRGVTRFEGDKIVVFSRPEHASRRVRDFLKRYAQDVFSERLAEKCARIDLKPGTLRVADPKSRWGSCGGQGQIMLSWRLLLAPVDVLDYVIAHEVAHRVHMNHSRRFWALCLQLCDGDGIAARRWLKKHGNALLAYR